MERGETSGLQLGSSPGRGQARVVIYMYTMRERVQDEIVIKEHTKMLLYTVKRVQRRVILSKESRATCMTWVYRSCSGANLWCWPARLCGPFDGRQPGLRCDIRGA
jgi:hypothetical protein